MADRKGHVAHKAHKPKQEGEQSFRFEPEAKATAQARPASPALPTVSWEASEYVHHEKGPSWFLGFSIAGAILVVLLFVLIDWFSALVVTLMIVALIVYANRQPQTLRYSIDDRGISVGERIFPYTDFRSFTLFQEGDFLSVILQPMRRFMPPLTLYFTPQEGDQIVNALSVVLPHEDREPDIVDRLVRRLRF